MGDCKRVGARVEVRTDGVWKYVCLDNRSASIVGTSVRLHGKIVIPDSVSGLAVTAIGRNALALQYEMTDLTVPDSVTRLGEGCFKYSNIRSLTLPLAISYLPTQCLMMCELLVSLRAVGLTRIGVQALFETLLRRLVCPSLVQIDAAACLGTMIEELNLPNLKRMGRCGFYRCANLKRASLSESLDTLPPSAFAYCRSLREVDIRPSVQSVGEQAFVGCSDDLVISNASAAVREYCRHNGIRCS